MKKKITRKKKKNGFWKTEKRISALESQFIQYASGKSKHVLNAYDYYEALHDWIAAHTFLGKMVFMVTYTFNDLPDGVKGYEVAADLIGKNYRTAMLPQFVDRRRHHKFPERAPLMILFPEYIGGSMDLHFHGYLIFDYKFFPSSGVPEDSLDRVRNKFALYCNHNRELHIQRVGSDASDLDDSLSYFMKKNPFLPAFVRNGTVNDFLIFG